ncbi:MAG: ATP-binding cassette domain-containing protein, partial [Burkholderiales bacterium]
MFNIDKTFEPHLARPERAIIPRPCEKYGLAVLSIENIEAGYAGIPVLRGVSATIERNEAVAIIGANGAGKSTLVRA